jgi:hypothetical protein
MSIIFSDVLTASAALPGLTGVISHDAFNGFPANLMKVMMNVFYFCPYWQYFSDFGTTE